MWSITALDQYVVHFQAATIPTAEVIRPVHWLNAKPGRSVNVAFSRVKEVTSSSRYDCVHCCTVVFRPSWHALTNHLPTAAVPPTLGLMLINRVPTADDRRPGRRARRDGVGAAIFDCGGHHRPVQDCGLAGAAAGRIGW